MVCKFSNWMGHWSVTRLISFASWENWKNVKWGVLLWDLKPLSYNHKPNSLTTKPCIFMHLTKGKWPKHCEMKRSKCNCEQVCYISVDAKTRMSLMKTRRGPIYFTYGELNDCYNVRCCHFAGNEDINDLVFSNILPTPNTIIPLLSYCFQSLN